MKPPPLLQVRELRAYFKTRTGPARAVDGVSFEIFQEETYAIVGESGSGKSVTALSVLQLLPQPAGYIAGGEVLFDGRNIAKLPAAGIRKVRGNDISMVFQEPMTALNPVFSVGRQVVEVLRLHRGMSGRDARRYGIAMLDEVGIPEPDARFDEYPHQLSGGMRQRVMIAMALACRPKLLIADEPTTALDVTIQSQILALIRKLQQSRGTAVLLITHDMGVVRENADRVGVMYAGKLVEEAPAGELFANPAHPYSELLMRALPSRTLRGRKLDTIEGVVPKATTAIPGCRFCTRCPVALPACPDEPPPRATVRDGHSARCHLHNDGRAQPRPVIERTSPAGPSPDPPASDRPLPRGERWGKGSNHLSPRGRGRSDAGGPGEGPAGDAPGGSAPPQTTCLEVRDLRTHFPIRKGLFKRTVGHVKAVDGLTLTLCKGETLALVGESGCGKTTVGKSIIRLVDPTGGSISFGGKDLSNVSRSALRPLRKRIQFVFQDPFSSLDPRMMVGETLVEAMETHGIESDRAARAARARDLLERVGLDTDMAGRYPHEFSGGQRQRIALARALATEPDLIICDEATSALDVSVQAQILNLLKDLQAELGLSYVFITHDLSVVEYLADRVAVMYLGRIVEEGTTNDIFDNARHPYTQALLSAVPQVQPGETHPKIILEGDVPSPINPPPGCHFHPRCPGAVPDCARAYPEPVAWGDTHRVRCVRTEAPDGRHSAQGAGERT